MSRQGKDVSSRIVVSTSQDCSQEQERGRRGKAMLPTANRKGIATGSKSLFFRLHRREGKREETTVGLNRELRRLLAFSSCVLVSTEANSYKGFAWTDTYRMPLAGKSYGEVCRMLADTYGIRDVSSADYKGGIGKVTESPGKGPKLGRKHSSASNARKAYRQLEQEGTVSFVNCYAFVFGAKSIANLPTILAKLDEVSKAVNGFAFAGLKQSKEWMQCLADWVSAQLVSTLGTDEYDLWFTREQRLNRWKDWAISGKDCPYPLPEKAKASNGGSNSNPLPSGESEPQGTLSDVSKPTLAPVRDDSLEVSWNLYRREQAYVACESLYASY